MDSLAFDRLRSEPVESEQTVLRQKSAGMQPLSSIRGHLRVKTHVYWQEVDGQVILLDMNNGKYFALDRSGSNQWKTALGSESVPGRDHRVCVEEAQIDLLPFVERLRANNLLEVEQDSGIGGKHDPGLRAPALLKEVRSSRAELRMPLGTFARAALFVETYLALISIDVCLLRNKFHGICISLLAMPDPSENNGARMKEIKSVVNVALSAFKWYRPGAACMHRALSVYRILRRRQISAQLCIGVKLHPFSSHAWIEFQETVLDDSPSVKERFRVIARIG